MIIVTKSVFQEGSKYYPKVFSDKCFIMIELTFLKVLILIRQVHQKSALFATNGFLQMNSLCFRQMTAMVFIIDKWCLWTLAILLF